MFSGGKGGRCVGLTTLPPSCADCLEILKPQPSGTLRAVGRYVSKHLLITTQDESSERYASICIIVDTFAEEAFDSPTLSSCCYAI
jgi:hypothetical protein